MGEIPIGPPVTGQVVVRVVCMCAGQCEGVPRQRQEEAEEEEEELERVPACVTARVRERNRLGSSNASSCAIMPPIHGIYMLHVSDMLSWACVCVCVCGGGVWWCLV
jgi:hypothetical protein